MRRTPRRISPTLIITSLLCGVLITFLTAGPASFFHTWLGNPGGSYYRRNVEPMPREFGPWAFGHTTGIFTDTWMVNYPGEYAMREEDPQPLIGDPPAWVCQPDKEDYIARENPYGIITTGFGWPFAAFRTINWSAQRYPPGATRNKSSRLYVPQREHAWTVLTAQHGAYLIEFVIPTSPILPGLIANVAFWSSLTAAAWLGLAHLRTTLRRRRSLCTACAYSRQGLEAAGPCPECGHSADKAR